METILLVSYIVLGFITAGILITQVIMPLVKGEMIFPFLMDIEKHADLNSLDIKKEEVKSLIATEEVLVPLVENKGRKPKATNTKTQTKKATANKVAKAANQKAAKQANPKVAKTTKTKSVKTAKVSKKV